MEEVVVRPRQLRQVLGVELPLEVPPALADPGQEHVEPRLQVDDEVRLHHPRAEMLVDALVEGQLVRVERDRGEDPVFGEEVVAHGGLREQVLLEQLLLLLEPVEQEEELRLEGVLVAVLVEAGQEGVLLDDLEHAPRGEVFRQRPRERRLSHADGTFDDDVALLQLHGGRRSAQNRTRLQH